MAKRDSKRDCRPSAEALRLYDALRWPRTGHHPSCGPGRPGAGVVRSYLDLDPCAPSCPGWFIDGDLTIITRCDECVMGARQRVSGCRDPKLRNPRLRSLNDDDLLVLPEAVLDLLRQRLSGLLPLPATMVARVVRQEVLLSALNYRGVPEETTMICPTCNRESAVILDRRDTAQTCTGCDAPLVLDIDDTVSLITGQCQVHQDCRDAWAVGRACWLARPYADTAEVFSKLIATTTESPWPSASVTF